MVIILRILIIEDEYNLADAIFSRLKKENYTIDISLDGKNGLENALTDIYDLIILDIMLPKINGIEILKQIKNSNIKAKIIMLTAKTELEDKLLGFECGANDYITKPFHIEELVARVNSQLRNNSNQKNHDYLEVGDLRLNIRTSNLECTTLMNQYLLFAKNFNC